MSKSEAELIERLTEPQRRVIRELTDMPEMARRGGWSPVAAFNLVRWGYVRLHQSYAGDSYSLTKLGTRLKAALPPAALKASAHD